MKVSVATITFNHEPFIAEAIESVLMQETDFPFEYVIGEDCSTDRTREIIKDFAQRFPEKIRPLFHEQNVGAATNYVRTLAQCRGDYIAFLDGDDFWTAPDKLQKQGTFLDAHPECSMCFHPIQKLTEDGRLSPFYPPRKQGDLYCLEDLLESNIVTSLSAMSRAPLFSGFPEWHTADSGTVGDWVHHVMVASLGDIGYIDEIMGVHRVHAGGQFSAIGDTGRLKQSMKTLALLDQELEFKYTERIQRSLTKMYLDLAKAQLRAGSRSDARESMSRVFRGSPFRSQAVNRKMGEVLLELYFPFLVAPMMALKKKFASQSDR